MLVEVIYDCWAFFAIKLTLLTFPVFSLLLFSFLRTIPSVLPGSECRWMRMVILLSRSCFSPLWFKEKTIIHKAPVHSRNYMKSPKHCLPHSKSSAWLLKWGPRISWQNNKKIIIKKRSLTSLYSCSWCNADIPLLGVNSPVCLEEDCKHLIRD